MSRSTRIILAAVVLLVGFSWGDAWAQGLFAPSSAKSGPAVGDNSPGVVRWRPTDIDVGYLMGQISTAAKGAGQSSKVTLNLFDDVVVPIEVWDTGVGGVRADRVLSGWVPQSENSLATLVVNQGRVSGKVWADGALYRFRPDAQGGYVVAEVDTSRFPQDEETPYPPAARGVSKAPTGGSARGEPISLLVLFTRAAAKKAGNVRDEVTLWVAEMNEIHRRSGSASDNMFRLVGIKTLDYRETDIPSDVKRLVAMDDGFMDQVHALRDRLGADLVNLVRNGGKSCGRAGALGPMPGETRVDSKATFSVVNFDCASDNLSFAHELGHNLGARHDYLADGTPGFNHGYVNVPAKWRTVMAYNTKCKNAGKYCKRMPFFSNPNKAFKGAPTGVHKNRTEPAFNVDLIRQNRSLIAAFRTPNFQRPPPRPPVSRPQPPRAQPSRAQPSRVQPQRPPAQRPAPPATGGWQAITQ